MLGTLFAVISTHLEKMTENPRTVEKKYFIEPGPLLITPIVSHGKSDMHVTSSM